MLWTFDRVIVPTGFTAAMIRLGNLMNHEIYGDVTSQPWGFRFIENVGAWKAGVAQPIFSQPSHPTQIYEALVYFLVFAVTMIMIFLSRFFIEYIKEVQVESEILMRQNTGLILGQWLSIPFVIWGIWLVWNAYRNDKKGHQPEVIVGKKKKSSNFITK
jgi:prolipoprotein diacylglyceryltransferase